MPFTVSSYLFSFQGYKGLKIGKMIENWYRGLGKNHSKLTKSVTSCDGCLGLVDLLMYYSSASTCPNQVKLFTLKVQNYVQLAIAKFCFSIKDCQSQTSFNDFTIKGLEQKYQPKDQNFQTAMRKSVLPFGSEIPVDSEE